MSVKNDAVLDIDLFFPFTQFIDLVHHGERYEKNDTNENPKHECHIRAVLFEKKVIFEHVRFKYNDEFFGILSSGYAGMSMDGHVHMMISENVASDNYNARVLVGGNTEWEKPFPGCVDYLKLYTSAVRDIVGEVRFAFLMNIPNHEHDPSFVLLQYGDAGKTIFRLVYMVEMYSRNGSAVVSEGGEVSSRLEDAILRSALASRLSALCGKSFNDMSADESKVADLIGIRLKK